MYYHFDAGGLTRTTGPYYGMASTAAGSVHGVAVVDGVRLFVCSFPSGEVVARRFDEPEGLEEGIGEAVDRRLVDPEPRGQRGADEPGQRPPELGRHRLADPEVAERPVGRQLGPPLREEPLDVVIEVLELVLRQVHPRAIVDRAAKVFG